MTDPRTNPLLQHGLSGSTLVLVLVTALFGREALDTQLQATDQNIEVVVDLEETTRELTRELITLRTDVVTLGDRVRALEQLDLAAVERRAAERDARLDDLGERVSRLAQCIAEGKRCRVD